MSGDLVPPHTFQPDAEMADVCNICGAIKDECDGAKPVKSDTTQRLQAMASGAPAARKPTWCRRPECDGHHDADSGILPHVPRQASGQAEKPSSTATRARQGDLEAPCGLHFERAAQRRGHQGHCRKCRDIKAALAEDPVEEPKPRRLKAKPTGELIAPCGRPCSRPQSLSKHRNSCKECKKAGRPVRPLAVVKKMGRPRATSVAAGPAAAVPAASPPALRLFLVELLVSADSHAKAEGIASDAAVFVTADCQSNTIVLSVRQARVEVLNA